MMVILGRILIAATFIVGTVLVSAGGTTVVHSKQLDQIKLGYLVKQPEEVWFQTEWEFADKVGEKYHFRVMKMAVPDGSKTLSAIDTLAAAGAKGFVICTPDPKLGPAVIARAKSNGLKVVTVDDQFLNAQGKPMSKIPVVMMAASKIGYRQGQELYKDMKRRHWDAKTTAVMVINDDELDTARRRVNGSIKALKAKGFPASKIYRVPTKTNDIPGAFDAGSSLLVQHPDVKQWLIVGMNDNTVLGGVRAAEDQGFSSKNVSGIGINGVDAISELSKKEPTGFYGSLLPSPDIHGLKSVQMLYRWVKDGIAPPLMTEVEDVTLITRKNFRQVLDKKGLGSLLKTQ